jgi:DNA-binding protein H-NS
MTFQDPMTKTTYLQIQKQIETLRREADKLKRKEVDDVIEKIKEAVRVYELTAADLGLDGRSGTRRGRGPAARKPGRPAVPARSGGAKPVKFRDESGNIWGGRGPRPQWLRDALSAGKALQDFAV